MQPLIIEAKKDSPAIRFDPETRIFEIEGESYPENAASFYEPVFLWLEEFLARPDSGPTTLELRLTYLNSSSSKILLNLLDLFEKAAKNGTRLEVRWHYHKDNETLRECGEEFAEDLRALPFLLISYDPEKDS